MAGGRRNPARAASSETRRGPRRPRRAGRSGRRTAPAIGRRRPPGDSSARHEGRTRRVPQHLEAGEQVVQALAAVGVDDPATTALNVRGRWNGWHILAARDRARKLIAERPTVARFVAPPGGSLGVGRAALRARPALADAITWAATFPWVAGRQPQFVRTPGGRSIGGKWVARPANTTTDDGRAAACGVVADAHKRLGPGDLRARMEVGAPRSLMPMDHALGKVWDAVAAAGADDHVAFLEHPALPAWAPSRQGARERPAADRRLPRHGVMGAPMARKHRRRGPERPGLEPHSACLPRRPAPPSARSRPTPSTARTLPSPCFPTSGRPSRSPRPCWPATAPDAIWAQMGTQIGIEDGALGIDLAHSQGRAFVDAPVLGTLKPAEDGKLTVSLRPRLRGRALLAGALRGSATRRCAWARPAC